MNAHYASVQDQVGIYAGDDGYQIKVNKNTDLKGAIITSTQAAENLKKNSLDTGTLTSSNIQNVTEYDAKGISVGGGFNAGKTSTAGNKEPGTVLSTPNKIDQHASTTVGVSKSVGFGLDSDKDSSVTKSGINTQNITIRDEQGQQALTGKTAGQIKSEILTSVTTDTARETSGALQNNFDKDKVLKEINTQVSVTQKFGENAPKAVADYAQKQALILRAQGNEAEAKKWDEGGIYRVAMHTALGALGTGTLEGAITTGTVAASAPKINDFQNSVAQALTHTGMSEKAAEAVASGVTSLTLAGAGVASGLNTGSTATAVNVDANNRQLHVDEAKVLKKLTEGKTEVEQTRLRAAACALVHCSEGVPESDVNYKTLKAFEALGKTYIKEQNALKATGLFTYSNWDKANDIRTNHDEAVTRVGGAGKVITGSVTAIGGSAAGAGLCTTGLGCAVGAPLAGVSVVGGVSTAIEGKNQVFGDYTSQEGKKVIDSYNPNRKQELSQLSQDALNGAIAVAEAVLLGKVGGKLSQGAKSEAKTSEQVMNDGTKSGTKTNSEITVNPITGLKEVNPSTTPLNSHDKLNKLDQGKLKPAEAATGAQLESVLGPMKKYELSGGQLNKNPDWEIVSGPNKGKTVDAMYTTDNLSQKEIDGLNKFYEKNMTMGSGKQNIQEHLNKADFVPIDFRVLTPNNQKIFLNYLQSLPKSQRDKIIIVR